MNVEYVYAAKQQETKICHQVNTTRERRIVLKDTSSHQRTPSPERTDSDDASNALEGGPKKPRDVTAQHQNPESLPHIAGTDTNTPQRTPTSTSHEQAQLYANARHAAANTWPHTTGTTPKNGGEPNEHADRMGNQHPTRTTSHALRINGRQKMKRCEICQPLIKRLFGPANTEGTCLHEWIDQNKTKSKQATA